MKKYTLFILLLILSVTSFAQEEEDYQKFVVEGKIWNCARINYFLPDENYDLKFFIKGDTTINNIEYKKMYSYNLDNDGRTLYEMALRENDKKVYKIDQEKPEEEMLYDFSLKVEDKVIEGKGLCVNYIVYLIDTIIIHDKNLRCIYMREPSASCGLIWVEGVGGGCTPVNPFGWLKIGGWIETVSCTLNGVELMNRDKFKNITDEMDQKVTEFISSVKSTKQTPKRVQYTYDLQGREVKEPLKTGIYLRDGKKISVK
ncbi:MAG: hypothetical protein PHU66_00775 [Bacteroidaceae bacterium]|nr:hypothetical protein [Bacteroidaceae bacterium]